jgi:hypothetical protein
MGANIDNGGNLHDTVELSDRQLILVFVGMLVAFFTCLVILCAEKAFSIFHY